MKRDLTCIAKEHPMRVLETMVYGMLALAALSMLLLILALPAQAQTETVLYNFGSQAGDGHIPRGGRDIRSKGNLYGTTGSAGAHGSGTVFELTAGGSEKVLYSFGSQSGDGKEPYAGVTSTMRATSTARLLTAEPTNAQTPMSAARYSS